MVDASAADAGARMDRMYRLQRHIYDPSRKFYLLGRDLLLAELRLAPGQTLCEIGCGTGRNLAALARRYPEARLYGIDASEEMLRTARAQLARDGLAGRIILARCLAEAVDPVAIFGLAAPFDAVIFSYTLSMIPDWQAAIDRAIAVLKPGGLLGIVDFSEQRGLPRWFRALLRRWLVLFEVTPRADLPTYLQRQAEREQATLALASLYGDYACLLSYRKAA
jgi:S-adenosylmethionine-diacylgycerolhomoserine-N-methlytransferase